MESIKELDYVRKTMRAEIDKVISKKSAPRTLSAISSAAGKLLTTVRLELEYYKFVGREQELRKAITTLNKKKQSTSTKRKPSKR